MRFVLGVDDDLGEFHRRFRRDPLLGPLIRRMPELPAAAPALALGGAGRGGGRAADRGRARGHDRAPHRRPLGAAARRRARTRCATSRRGGDRRPRPGRAGGDGPRPEPGGGAAAGGAAWSPAAAAGSTTPAADRRLLAMPQIGPWTVQCLGLFGRGEMDSLPAGDLGYIKLVGRLAGLGRRATVAEVEEFYAPYEPYRGPGRRADPRRPAPAGRPGPAAAPRRLSDRCPPARVRAWTDVRSSVSDDLSITTRCRRKGTGTGPTTRSTNSSTRSPLAGRTTGAWSSACR